MPGPGLSQAEHLSKADLLTIVVKVNFIQCLFTYGMICNAVPVTCLKL